ncbi:hypothetical protein Scep_004014 [Stephania cephalantha]|uniref:Uncharacterized protein n=1 Tax=Stephania cephalantha TaxID=152367 RepID=A0AAP0KU60_9MAGN
MSKAAPWQIPLPRARPRLGRFLCHEQGRALAGSFGTSKTTHWQIPLERARSRLGTNKVASWHEQGIPWHEQGIPWQGLTKLDLGVDQVKVLLVSFLDVSYWSNGNGLTSTIRRGVSSPRGGMGMEAREPSSMPRGTMPRQDPRTHGLSHPEPVGLYRAPAST